MGTVEPVEALHLAADGGERPIATDDDIGVDGSVLCCGQRHRRALEIHPHTAVLEVVPHSCVSTRLFEKRLVQPTAADGVDRVAWVCAVGLEAEPPCDGVDHSAAHRDRLVEHPLGQPGEAQRMNPPGREGEVDRPAPEKTLLAGIGPALVDRDLVPRLAQQTRQQRARQARPHNDDVLRRGIQQCSGDGAPVRSRAKRQTSQNVL